MGLEEMTCVPRKVGKALKSAVLTYGVGTVKGIKCAPFQMHVEFPTLSTPEWD